MIFNMTGGRTTIGRLLRPPTGGSGFFPLVSKVVSTGRFLSCFCLRKPTPGALQHSQTLGAPLQGGEVIFRTIAFAFA
jgi:hypothetical protein